MKLISGKPEDYPIVIEFTSDEARRFAASLMDDVTWYQTSQEKLYNDLYELLIEATGDEY